MPVAATVKVTLAPATTVWLTGCVVIVGGGIAGAATAYFLTQKHFDRVIVIERERVPGAGSTGRNAAILRTLSGRWTLKIPSVPAG